MQWWRIFFWQNLSLLHRTNLETRGLPTLWRSLIFSSVDDSRNIPRLRTRHINISVLKLVHVRVKAFRVSHRHEQDRGRLGTVGLRGQFSGPRDEPSRLMKRLRSALVYGWYAVQMPIDLHAILAAFTSSFHTHLIFIDIIPCNKRHSLLKSAIFSVKQGVEENIWTEEGRGNGGLEKIA